MNAALHLVADRHSAPAVAFAARPPRWHLLLSAASSAHAALALQTVMRAHEVSLAGLQGYTDPASGWHHCRGVIDDGLASLSIPDLRRRLAPLAAQAPLRVHIGAAHELRRVVVLVSKADHCLRELLQRRHDGELAIDIACVISNHDDLGPLALAHGVPFHCVPMAGPDAGGSGRTSAFERVFELFEQYRGDVMVLARFMQILPPDFCARAAGRILNVHHSLLPAFSGARAYHQAWQQGVKWIGATCHYVTAELDQGPIIDQDARRIDHAHSVDDLVRAGRDLERRVLVAGLRAHVEDRVVVSGQRTVIFDR
ncbi:MAG: formyltetrahydrofolate deformylase [Rubrivivax sp.]|nr:formyltetrahydrofolate deformylase [Rubrivivax sp.]